MNALSKNAFSAAVRLNEVVAWCVMVLACACFLVMNLSVIGNVIAREVFRYNVIWSSDVALFSFVWTTMLSAALGVRHQAHFVTEIVDGMIARSRSIGVFVELLVLTVVVAVGLFLMFSGFGFVEQSMLSISFTLGIPVGYIAVILPLSGVLFIVFQLEHSARYFLRCPALPRENESKMPD